MGCCGLISKKKEVTINKCKMKTVANSESMCLKKKYLYTTSNANWINILNFLSGKDLIQVQKANRFLRVLSSSPNILLKFFQNKKYKSSMLNSGETLYVGKKNTTSFLSHNNNNNNNMKQTSKNMTNSEKMILNNNTAKYSTQISSFIDTMNLSKFHYQTTKYEKKQSGSNKAIESSYFNDKQSLGSFEELQNTNENNSPKKKNKVSFFNPTGSKEIEINYSPNKPIEPFPKTFIEDYSKSKNEINFKESTNSVISDTSNDKTPSFKLCETDKEVATLRELFPSNNNYHEPGGGNMNLNNLNKMRMNTFNSQIRDINNRVNHCKIFKNFLI
jgi:hypothetical protein